VLASFAAYWATTVLVAWLPSYLTTVVGYDTRSVGSLVVLPWAVMGIGMVVQALLTQRLLRNGVSSRWARGVLGGACVIVAGVALLVGSLAGNGTPKLILLAIGFGLGGVIIVVGQTTSAEISPSNRRGGVLGTYAAIYSIAGIVSPVLTGILVGSYAVPAVGYTVAFVITALLLIVGGVLSTIFVRPERHRLRLAARAAQDVKVPESASPDELPVRT
ncbi:MAG: MFS transporter, partial [Actinomycetes bacterium]